MSSQNELYVTLEWLDAALPVGTGGATGVYRGSAPPDAAPPYIVVTHYGGSDVMGVAGARIWSNNTWLIEAWGLDINLASVKACADAIDAALHQQRNISTPSGTIISSVREQPRMDFMIEGSQQWARIGGVYRIEAKGN